LAIYLYLFKKASHPRPSFYQNSLKLTKGSLALWTQKINPEEKIVSPILKGNINMNVKEADRITILLRKHFNLENFTPSLKKVHYGSVM